MNAENMVDLLSWVQGFDRRTIGKMDVVTWLAVAHKEGWTTDEARDAVTTWYSRTTQWIAPANVTELIRLARRDQRDRQDAEQRAIERERRPRPVKALAARIGRLTYGGDRDDPDGASVEPGQPPSVACRHCGAQPYQPCTRRTFRRGRMTLVRCPPHPSRKADLATAVGLIR